MDEALKNLLFGTFLGALLTIVSGSLVNQSWRQRVDRERREQLRAAMKRVVSYDLDRLDDTPKQFADNGVPSRSMDLCLLDATASLKYELLGTAFCGDIDRMRFDLAHTAPVVALGAPRVFCTRSGSHKVENATTRITPVR